MQTLASPKTTLVENCFAMYPNCSSKDLLKYTIIELLINGTLELKKELKRPSPNAPLKPYFSIKRGANFNSKKHNSYQNLITKVFENTDNYISLRNLGWKVQGIL